ncbi:MAG: single-stranded-DNA-specific exonuclease RecJ [Coriobacteriia bacterium]
MDERARRTPWALAPADESSIVSLAAARGLTEVTARVLVSRGVTADDVDAFLDPTLERDWRDPSLIPGMDEAASEVADAVRDGKRIVVFGDYDLDGISSAALATHGLRALGADALAVVPHRFDEGYGLSAPAVERLLSHGPDLVVTVDCGVSSDVEIAALLARGVRVVVTDHHETSGQVPDGVPVADPKLVPEGAAAYPFPGLAGAGVALKLIHAVGRLLGEPDAWRELTDLAALGTVADIVPLVDENRALVTDGLRRMREAPRPGIAALAAVAEVDLATLGSDGIAFALGPRLNAAGRMADPVQALDLLLTDDTSRAVLLATALEDHNRRRQETEAELALEAEPAAIEQVIAGRRAAVIAREGWHEGVKGIVASRLASSLRVPAIVCSVSGGVATGSGRSVPSVDLFVAVSACAEVLERFGGHAAAVGVTLLEADLPRFRDLLDAAIAAQPPASTDVRPVADAEVGLHAVDRELVAELALLEPFGEGNPRPVLATGGVFMTARKRVGKDGRHLRFTAYDGAASLPAIAFRCEDIGEHSERDSAVDLVYEVEADSWQGRERVQLRVRRVFVHGAEEDAPAADLVDDLFSRADEIVARGEYAGIGDADAFHTKLAGVTFEGRQEVVARLLPGTPLRLVRESENPHDGNACALADPHGDRVGYCNRRLAAVLAPLIDAGVEYDVSVADVTGGGEGTSLGVNVLIERRMDEGAQSADETAAETRASLASLPATGLDDALRCALIGDRPLHSAQSEALAHLAASRSCLLVMATGRGKSLVFHMHAARRAIAAGKASVFVYPLRALVSDQAYHLEETLASVGLTVKPVTGESTQAQRDRAFDDLAAGDLDVVLTTPEFLDRHAGRFAASGRVEFVVVDEAHHVRLSRAGHRPAYGRLDRALEILGGPTVLAATATCDDETADAVRASLGASSVVLDPTVRENLRVEDRRGHGDRRAYVASLADRGDKVVVYVNSRDTSVGVARAMRERAPGLFHRVAFYNGGLARPARHAVEAALREGDITGIVATSAFGEGVDIADVRHIVLYHMPFNSVEFNQLSGRAGRDGREATVHLLYGKKDAGLNERILESCAPERDDLASLYLCLKDLDSESPEGFEVTNADLAERVRRRRPASRLSEDGVSTGIGVFRELELAASEGTGAYRRLRLLPAPEGGVDLAASVRYAEGRDEIEEFASFKEWALTASAQQLLARFDRPILPTRR